MDSPTQLQAPAQLRPYVHPNAWTRAELLKTDDWLLQLDAHDNREIQQALAHARSHDLHIPGLSREGFPLPTLGAKLERMCEQLVNGKGLAVVRGFDIDALSIEDAALAYWGIGSFLGKGKAQNMQGDLLGHVTDLGIDFHSNQGARGYQSRLMLPFHNDALDIVGLLCLQVAKQGGKSRFVSSTALYNAVLERRPDLARTLHEPIYLDRRGEEPAGTKPWHMGSVFEWVGERLFVRYNRTYIQSAQRFPDIPRLTPQQLEAFDLMDSLSRDPEYHVEVNFERGEMQFLCNYTTLHSRSAYEDWPERERRRYLLRLWLDTGRIRDLPPSYRERFVDMERWQTNPKPPIFDHSARRNELAHS